ncbi:hypothetical protein R69927_06240 [Paraburkholderia domus]|nr:hypothetical protein R75483_07327 [Paraburkholderia domus]CAE6915249.1 hypothetical protein R69927_06240 [Paraburkholderia domus]CAE6950039.1 hypothetical protein R70199_06594 [Paraburkholderia domus]CAE6958726.1 hypothetical protein R75471_06442 [Paraburkholderia domus]
MKLFEGPLNVRFRLGREKSSSKAFNAHTTYIATLIKGGRWLGDAVVPLVDPAKARSK